MADASFGVFRVGEFVEDVMHVGTEQAHRHERAHGTDCQGMLCILGPLRKDGKGVFYVDIIHIYIYIYIYI